MLRKIVQIDEARCDGCGLCIPSCAEGAIALVGGKARLVGDVLCDGLGACLGECPQGAITVIEREAPAFDEAAVREHLASAGRAAPPPHAPAAPAAPSRPPLAAVPPPRPRLAVVADAGPAPSGGGCPGARPQALPRRPLAAVPAGPAAPRESRLAQWPIQLHLVPETAPWLAGADLLVAADCVPFAFAGFHEELLAGRAVLVGCPKLDDNRAYAAKLTRMLALNEIRSVTVVRMEVPCCGGIAFAVREALTASGKAAAVPLRDAVVTVDGALRG
jgi:NAD-dependent dihydropyrimidine dehydrogenase PreA subunit